MTTNDARKVKCGTHGQVEPAYVCRHLVRAGSAPLGFNEPDFDPDDPDDRDLQAWCDACDQVLSNEHDWTEAAMQFADIRMVCEFCFAKLRKRHQI